MTVLGLGTYRCRDAEFSARVAAAAGCPLIDTAAVYGAGTHQRAIAPILRRYPKVRVATKIGHMTAKQARTATAAGALPSVNLRHSIMPSYVRHQLAASAAELGRERLDFVYLHNPDHGGASDRDGLHQRIRSAMVELEWARTDGLIGGYGIATWSGFTDGAFTVDSLVALARQAAGGPNTSFAAIQLPVSLVEITPIAQALAGFGPIAEAQRAGLEVWASAPLHGGELVHLVNDALAAFIRQSATAAEAALAVAASTPGLTGVLLSTSNAEHWNRAAHAVARLLPPPRLREISDLLTRAI
ncbi:aldo/keto reductase [Marinitenerispora sediminis]|uniref:NADP-dependent oxidoreductase domain-containing protein n=1 Tax=Marinitenerispora sediminis TaxID=1931232 RepID=A0A368TCB7_9ACTN|nr:aldo/keto reductase [Marinitenerispora sediminis]RCV56123.1 hypothetical protein DEF23_13145 [Marinitenerispora sediminis]RCV57990.1 hypothetical protein DEF28_00845 [Marinitenerispora sediminis]RCV62590.1 hypothetical protein DEF24_00570 [Marinitenerispora sediminis]